MTLEEARMVLCKGPKDIREHGAEARKVIEEHHKKEIAEKLAKQQQLSDQG